jgi:outer membrane protein TolC
VLPVVGLGEVMGLAGEVVSAAEAGELRGDALELLEDALRRESLPGLTVSAGGDYGQRARPGEERAVGVGARGDAVVLLGWTLADGVWEARRMELGERRRAAALEVELGRERRAVELARAYLEAGAAQADWRALGARREQWLGLVEVVGRRHAAGVESDLQKEELAAALAAVEHEQALARQRLREETALMAVLAGRAVRARSWEGWAGGWGGLPMVEVGADGAALEAELLRQQARGERAAGEVARREGRWRFEVLGSAGAYGSEAFDGGVEPEYYAGLRASWRPDLGGERRRRAEAAELRARALEREVEVLGVEARGLGERVAALWQEQDGVRGAREREREQVARLEEVARLRWQRGVSGWREWLAAARRLDELEFAAREIDLELARALVDYAAASGRVGELAGWLAGGWE